jgi:hypothetical protein
MLAGLDGARALDDLVQLFNVAHIHGDRQSQTLEIAVEAGGFDEAVCAGAGGDVRSVHGSSDAVIVRVF